MNYMADSLLSSNESYYTEEEGEDEEDGELETLPLPWLIVSIVFIGLAILVAVVGNLLVLISYFRDRHLQNVHNLYLVNLAFSDLMIGLLSMPFYLVYTVLDWTWPFGPATCKFFLVEDFTFCDMTTMAVVLLAWDGLAMVQHGARYSIVETKRKAYIKLAVTWVFSFLLYSPFILFWDVGRGYSIIPYDDCDVEFVNEFEFTMFTELTSFSVPCLSLAVINAMLFFALKRESKVAQSMKKDAGQGKRIPSQSTTNATDTGNRSTSTAKVSPETSSQNTNRPEQPKVDRKQRDRRAGMILALLVVTLAVCWLPYSVSTILIAMCDTCVNEDLYEFFNWLLWIKSCINPFLYAYHSPRFQKNFRELLSPVLPAKWRAGSQGRKTEVTTVSPATAD